MNDRDTLCKTGAGTDPYVVFGTMLAGGDPPDDCQVLLTAAEALEAVQRFSAVDEGEPRGS
jgi:hypothetical protein